MHREDLKRRTYHIVKWYTTFWSQRDDVVKYDFVCYLKAEKCPALVAQRSGDSFNIDICDRQNNQCIRSLN